MIPLPAITAPDPVVHTWREEAGRCLHAANRPTDPALVDKLRFVPREVAELVADLAEALTHAAGILLASVANATPGARQGLDAELATLLDEVGAMRDRGVGGVGDCPIPDPGGAAYRCGCGPTSRAGCKVIADEIRKVAAPVDEGGVAS